MDRAELCNENNCSIKGARDVGGEGRGGTARREGEGGGWEGEGGREERCKVGG